MKKAICVTIEEDLVTKLDIKAKEQDRTRSKVVERVLKEELK